ncbi:S-layer protein [Actinotalea ferrariae CF5-4]|uniref:S-layer protein n=1 Tax=Actinotalea ferrariae CF5-4 TaxID=948458 RepID=A0A021VUH5_9CELL|nr:S-layer protein [Actinotalea ferrariae CF5-4]
MATVTTIVALVTAVVGPAAAATAATAPAAVAPITPVAAAISTSPAPTSAVPAGPVAAAVASDWAAGNIISDSVFFDPGTMTVAQVQAFLDDRGAACRPNADGLPCLKDIQVPTVAKAADGLCRGYAGGTQQTAAQIIVGVGLSCDVNPRVLIVLLEKEQSLVTRRTPSAYAYERATGFGCPDTAPCNEEYFGLFNQLYLAARQYQNYAANPDRYPRYRPQRTVDVLYHPKQDPPGTFVCGSSPVFIHNQATAGLYTYTPYQPNAAALANLYGTGDACSSYGNRNFWRLFTDWFGSTQAGSFLVRTATSGQVYLVVGSVKHPVNSLAVLSAYAPLGPVGTVSQVYLDRRTTGPALGRFVLASSGTVLFVDQGEKHTFSSCTLVAHYGGSCGALVSLSDVQLAAMPDDGVMRPTLQSPDGALFTVRDAVKHEAADQESLTRAGLSTDVVRLSRDAVAGLPYGDPIIRPGLVLTDRTTGATSLSHSAGLNPVPAALLEGTVLGKLPVRPLDAAGLSRLSGGAPLTPFVRRSTDDATMLLRGSSITRVVDPAAAPPAPPVVGSETLAGFTETGTPATPLFVEPVGSTVRYLVEGGVRRPVRDDAELRFLAGTSEPVVLRVTGPVAGLMPVGRFAALTQFDDVWLTQPFAEDIVWLAASGVTSGYADGTFRPTDPVSRQAMAAFLHRMAGRPAVDLPATPTYVDVLPGSQFYGEVEWLTAAGIATGTSAPDGTVRFAPTAFVSRRAMAAFLYRAAGSPAFTPPAAPTFADVPATAPFAREVEWLASVGVTTGQSVNGRLMYNPADPVSRQAMAAFLHRFDGL